MKIFILLLFIFSCTKDFTGCWECEFIYLGGIECFEIYPRPKPLSDYKEIYCDKSEGDIEEIQNGCADHIVKCKRQD